MQTHDPLQPSAHSPRRCYPIGVAGSTAISFCVSRFCAMAHTGPIHSFCHQTITAAVQHECMAIVQQARNIITSADYETVTVGVPLPMNPEAAPAGSQELSPEQRQVARDPDSSLAANAVLNWGPEGSEGPPLATGKYMHESLKASISSGVAVFNRGGYLHPPLLSTFTTCTPSTALHRKPA